MKTEGYTNPIRGMERRLAPDFPSREFRDPGLRSPSLRTSGLGSLHTMPHLRRLSPGVQKLQGGGALNPVGEVYAASRPNTYNPDPMRRRVLAALQFNARNPALFATPGTAPLPYAGGGEMDGGGGMDDGAPPDLQDLMQPEDQQPERDDEERQIVLEAMAALEGQAEDPEEAIAHFIDTFGPRALKDLQLMVETKHQQAGEQGEEDEDDDESGGGGEEEGDGEEEGAQEEEEPEPALAVGGLLSGPGTGQSDEIDAATPSGRPVLLSDGEYVIDAPTVAALGDGSTNAGARRLDALRKQIRQGAYGHDKQAKPMRKGGRSGIVLRIP
jgi:hypothetical protein